MIPLKGKEYVTDAALKYFWQCEVTLKKRSHTAEGVYKLLTEDECYLSEYIDTEDARAIFEEFLEAGLFVTHIDEFADTFYGYSDELNKVYDLRRSDPSTPLAKWDKHGVQFIKSALYKIFENADEAAGFETSNSIPASDRAVSLSDNQSEEAVSTLEQVIQEFQKDHHFNNEWVAEKNALLKALENGKDYLDAKILDVRIGTMMIVEPLQAIADKYKEAAVNGSFSALAQKALDFFINLFAG